VTPRPEYGAAGPFEEVGVDVGIMRAIRKGREASLIAEVRGCGHLGRRAGGEEDLEIVAKSAKGRYVLSLCTRQLHQPDKLHLIVPNGRESVPSDRDLRIHVTEEDARYGHFRLNGFRWANVKGHSLVPETVQQERQTAVTSWHARRTVA
jgi:hypothetical protein